MYLYQDKFLDIIRFEGNDCKPVVVTPDWKIQVLNYHNNVDINNLSYVEKHYFSDETFLLIAGRAFFLSGDDSETPGFIDVREMEERTLYNAKANCWHFVICETGASVIVIENADTTWSNSTKFFLEDTLKKSIREKIKKE